MVDLKKFAKQNKTFIIIIALIAIIVFGGNLGLFAVTPQAQCDTHNEEVNSFERLDCDRFSPFSPCSDAISECLNDRCAIKLTTLSFTDVGAEGLCVSKLEPGDRTIKESEGNCPFGSRDEGRALAVLGSIIPKKVFECKTLGFGQNAFLAKLGANVPFFDNVANDTKGIFLLVFLAFIALILVLAIA